MREIIADSRMMHIGKNGEGDALQVAFPVVAEWEALYGAGGVWTLNVQRNGDALAYAAQDFKIEDGAALWVVTDADAAVVGEGRCELTYKIGGTVAKSRTYAFRVDRSLTGGGDVPDPVKGWQEALEERVDGKLDRPDGGSAGDVLTKTGDGEEWKTMQSDWNEFDSTKPGYIKNKPLIPLGDYEIVMTYDETTKKYSLNTDNLPIDYHTDPDNRLDRAYQHVYENIYRRSRVPYITYRDTRSDRNQTIYFTLASASKYSYMGYNSSLVFTSTTNNTPYGNNGSFILRTIEWSYDDFDVPSVYENTFNASIFTGMLESKTYANKFYNYQNYLSGKPDATDIINNTSKYALAKLESYVGDKLLAPIMSLESIDDENITYSTITIDENGVIRRRGIKYPVSGNINYYKALIDEEYSFVAAQQNVSDAGKVLTVGEDGKVAPGNISLPPPTPPYTLPTASPTVLGGVKPIAKTDAMTQGVGVDDAGALWTAAGSGGTDISLGLTSAQVGQIVKVKAVDENGKPTLWEALNRDWEKKATYALKDMTFPAVISIPPESDSMLFISGTDITINTETKVKITLKTASQENGYGGKWEFSQNMYKHGWGCGMFMELNLLDKATKKFWMQRTGWASGMDPFAATTATPLGEKNRNFYIINVDNADNINPETTTNVILYTRDAL